VRHFSIVTTRLVVLAAVVALCCAAAASAARSPNPRFTLRATSTYVRHHVTHLVRKRDDSGCRQRNDVDTTQRLTTVTEGPSPTTFNELARGGRNSFRLAVRESRVGSLREGWEVGCPLLADNPAYVGDASGCGTKHYDISLGNTGIGYAGGDNFRFSYSDGMPDPYNGKCLIDFYRPEGSFGNSVNVAFPPRVWQVGKTKRKWWTDVARKKLLAGKMVVIRWKDSATIDTPVTLTPEAYDESVYRDTYTLSWTVTLRPTK
jgi:hypothetical protein